VPGFTRSLQLSRVAFGFPLLQLAAELFVTSYFTGRPVQPRPMLWDARISGGSASSAAGLRGGVPPLFRRASSAAAAYAVGRPDQLLVSQLSRGPTLRGARNQQPKTSPSRSVKRWPRLPLVGRRSRGIRGGPSRERRLAGPPAPPLVYAGRPICVKPSSSLVNRASSHPWSVGAAAGYAVDPPGNGHAQGRQLHRGFTRGGPNALGLAPLKHYRSFGQAMASTPPGGQRSCRTQWVTRGRPTRGCRPAAAPRGGGPHGQHHRKLCGVTRAVNR
jgi:hypothetical protein